MKPQFYVRKSWRCVGQEGDVFFRESKAQADSENHFAEPEEVFAIWNRDAREIIADAYERRDANRIRDALNAALAVAPVLGEMAGRIRALERASQLAQYTDTDAVWATFEETLKDIRKLLRRLNRKGQA